MIVGFCGGKTAGHIIPNTLIMKYIIKKGIDAYYLGIEGQIENEICAYEHLCILNINKYKKNLKSFIIAYQKAKHIIKKKNINFLFTTGGYSSLPYIIYAIFHHIPFYLYEENVCTGYTNMFIYPFAKKRLYAFDNKKNGEFVFMPIRYKKSAVKGKNILILSGSLGSKVMIELLKYFKDSEYEVDYIAGRYYREAMNYKQANINIYEYQNDLSSLISKASIIITRGGASSLLEAICLNKPLIIIPSRKTKRNHQIRNALFLARKNRAIYISEKSINKNTLLDTINILQNDNFLRLAMKKAQKEMVIEDAEKLIGDMIINEAL